MSDAFARLSPAMQYQIVNGLGFGGLRPVQEAAADAILDGKNCVVLAPTAGGKTEAAFFPLLSRMDAEDWRPVSLVYVAPIRALLNNLEERIVRYGGLIGRRAFKWHGDVAASAKQRFITDPTDILLTTPESLEVMLMSRKVPAERLFRGLRAVVIDEIHAFVGDDRGGHLAAVLERLTRCCGNDVQRIGLSATVGNPAAILSWMAGSSQRSGAVIDPGGGRTPPEIKLDWVANLGNAAHMIARLHPGKKRLVFVDSRRQVEALGQALRGLGVDTYVTHSSLSFDERQAAEAAFQDGHDCVIVATSALELGIDIGDLDHVLQLDAPSTVAAFLQRMGRTGRREGRLPNCTFLAIEPEGLLRAAAIIQLFRQGFVESVPTSTRSAHLLAHQLMALTIQREGGIPVSDWWAWVSAATPFRDLSADDRQALVAHMLAQDILAEADGRYVLGARGEKLYGWRNFAELYAVFSAPQTLKVLWGMSEIGSIDAHFAQQARQEELSFVLGARAWHAVAIDWREGFVRVEPMATSGLARWQGSPRLLSSELCQAMRAVLVGDDDAPEWSQRARARLVELRAEYALTPDTTAELVADGHGLRLWTFAGGKANNLFGKVLGELLGDKVVVDNLYIGFRDAAARSDVAIREAVARLRTEGRPDHSDALRLAESCGRGRLSKFQPCLPTRLDAEYLASVLTDEAGARRITQAATTPAP
ncbi:MAG: DEAD/DEAH box helicase [Myxococcales bacterium]|nr:DEAD/DEAH box helicase [Myxococcales bacterium]